MSSIGHNERSYRLDVLASDILKGWENVENGEEFTIGGWLAVGHAMNEARSLFNGNVEFGQWLRSVNLSERANDHDRAAAMWAAANADQFEEARQRGNPRTIRGIHAKWKEIEAEREQAEHERAMQQRAEETQKDAMARADAAKEAAEARAQEEREAKAAIESASDESERRAAEDRAAKAASDRERAEAEVNDAIDAIFADPVDLDQASDPYGYADLTEDAVLDLANGLRADLDDARAEAEALRAERDDLKARLSDATEGDQGATIGRLARQISTLKEARNDALAKAAKETRRANFIASERDDLRKRLEGQEVEI